MISVTALKNGKTFVDEGTPYVVTKYELQKIGRGGATVKLAVRNLETGQLSHKTYNSSFKFDEIKTSKKPLQYLYADGEMAIFMDQDDFNQIEIPKEVLGEQLSFVKEGEIVDVLFWEDKALSVDLAPKVTMTVKETAPGVKGNSASNMLKPATLENGLSVKVPLFIKVGDKIRVDTRTGEYLERAK